MESLTKWVLGSTENQTSLQCVHVIHLGGLASNFDYHTGSYLMILH